MSRPHQFASPLRVAKFAAVVWGCLFALSHAGPAGAEDPTGDMPFIRVYVPQENLREMARGHMSLPREQFEGMIEQLEQEAAEPPGLATPIPRTVYHARLEGGQLSEGTAVWEIEPAEGAALMSLSGVNLPILEPHWNGDVASTADLGWSQETGLVLLAPRAGNLHFAWSHAAAGQPLTSEGDAPLRFEFQLPPAGRTTLLLDTPQGWELRPGDAAATASVLIAEDAATATDALLGTLAAPPLAEGWRRWRIDTGDATKLQLIAVPSSAHGPHALVLLNQLSFCRIAENHVELRCELRLDVQNQPREQLVLELDPRLSLTAAQLADTPLEWHRVEHAAGAEGAAAEVNLVTLDFPEPLADGARTIELAAIASVVTGQPWTLPTIQVRNVFWQQAEIELQVEGNLELAQLAAGDCQQVETSFLTGPQGGERHKFQCAGQRDEITLVLRRRQAVVLGDTATRLLLGPSTMRGTLLARLSVERGLAFEVRGTIPAPWQIEDLEADQDDAIEYWELQPGPEGTQALLVRLREPLRAGSPLELVLRGERRMPETRPFALKELRMLELAAAEIDRETYYVGAETPSRPSLSSHALPVETVSQPADVPRGDLLGVATGDLTFHWQDFQTSRVPPQLDLKANPVQFRYDANVTIRVQDDVLHEQYVFVCSPESAEVSTLLVQFNQERAAPPTWSLEGESESALSARKLTQEELNARFANATGEVWEVQLRRPRKAPFRLEAIRTVPRSERLEVALAALPEATPQNCEVRVLRETAKELYVEANVDLARIPPTPPAELEYPNQIAAYRYQPERDVIAMTVSVLNVADAESSPFHSTWIRSLRLETLAFEGQRIEHRLQCEIENYGSRQLAFRLPAGVQLAELLVDGQPLPDALTSDPAAETMLALPANRRLVSVEFRLIGQSEISLGRQTLAAPLPEFEVPVLDATWTLWCPPGRELLGLSGPAASSSLPELGWRRRLFGPLARPTAATETNSPRNDMASMRRQVDWLLEDLQQADARDTGDFWSYLARQVQTPPAGAASNTRLPVLVDRATVTPPPTGDGTNASNVLKRLGLAMVVHPQAIILTDLRCDWLAHDCLESGGRANVWEITCDATLADVAHSIEGSTRFVPVELYSAELAAGGGPVAAAARLAPAGWTAHWFELPTKTGDNAEPTAAVLYRPASVQWLGLLGLLLVLPLVALLCSRSPSAAIVVVGVLGVTALLVPAWYVPITSFTLLGALGGVVFWMTLHTPRGAAERDTKKADRSRSTTSLKVPSTIGTAILFALLAAWAWASFATAQEPGGPFPSPERASVIYLLDENGEVTGDYVYVPESYYQELYRRMARLAREPGTWLLHSASYTAEPASYDDTTAALVELEATYEVETFADDATINLPTPHALLTPSAAAVQLDGRNQRARQAATGEGIAVDIALRGRHRLRVSFTLPIEANRRGRHAELPVPPLPSAQFVWDGQGELAVPESLGALGGTLERDPQTWLAELGPVDTIRLRWPPVAVELAGEIEIDQYLWLNVNPGSVVADTRFHLDMGEDAVSSLHLLVDRRLQVLQPAESSLIASITRSSENDREIVLEFREPLRGEQTFDLSFLVRGASGVGDLHLPSIELLGASGALRAVGITLDSSISYGSHTGEGLQVLDPEDFATRWGVSAGEPQRAFELGASGRLWSLATQRREPATVGAGQIDFLCGASEIEVNYQLELATSSGVVFLHQLQLPAEMQVEQVSVTQGGREQVARWTRDHNGFLTAFLAGPVSGPHQLSLQGRVPVTVIGEQPLPEVALTDADITDSLLRVYRAYDANVSVLPGGNAEVVPRAAGQPATSRGTLVEAFRVAEGSGQLSAHITPNAPLVSADSDLILERPTEGNWQARWRCFLHVENGQLDALRLLTPASWEGNVEVAGDCELAWNNTASADRRLLTIYPRQPWQGDSIVELTAPLPPRPSKPIEAPQFTLLEVDEWESRLVVPRRLNDSDLSWELQNLRSVALPEHSAAYIGDLTLWNAYEMMGGPYKAAHRTGAAPIGEPEVRLADIYLWWQPQGHGHGVARYDLLPAGNLACQVRVPESCEVIAARVEGVPANLNQQQDGRWEIELSSSQLPQRIEIVFQGQLATHSDRQWSLAAPGAGQPGGRLAGRRDLVDGHRPGRYAAPAARWRNAGKPTAATIGACRRAR